MRKLSGEIRNDGALTVPPRLLRESRLFARPRLHAIGAYGQSRDKRTPIGQHQAGRIGAPRQALGLDRRHDIDSLVGSNGPHQRRMELARFHDPR